MKKIIFLLLIISIFSSCQRPLYVQEGTITKGRITPSGAKQKFDLEDGTKVLFLTH